MVPAGRGSTNADVGDEAEGRVERGGDAPAADTGAGFVPVVVEEPASEAVPGRMEIVLGDDVRVVVDATVHAPALARVLAVVGRR